MPRSTSVGDSAKTAEELLMWLMSRPALNALLALAASKARLLSARMLSIACCAGRPDNNFARCDTGFAFSRLVAGHSPMAATCKPGKPIDIKAASALVTLASACAERQESAYVCHHGAARLVSFALGVELGDEAREDPEPQDEAESEEGKDFASRLLRFGACGASDVIAANVVLRSSQLAGYSSYKGMARGQLRTQDTGSTNKLK